MKKIPFIIFLSFISGCVTVATDHPSGFSHQSVAYDLVEKGWEALAKKDFAMAHHITDQCIQRYSGEAEKLNTPCREDHRTDCTLLDDVAQCLFIKSQAYLQTGHDQEFKKVCEEIMQEYSTAYVFDPRGWYPWKPADYCRDKLEEMNHPK